jgi:hypothetical protein
MAIISINKEEIRGFIKLHKIKIIVISAPVILALLFQAFRWGTFLLFFGIAGIYYVWVYFKREIDNY